MKKREYRDYLDDIAESIDDAISFIEGMVFEEFIMDKKTINAVVRSIEIIGAASGHIPKSIRDKAPDMPWAEMKGMRNRIAYEYFGVDNKIVWNTVKHNLPKLKQQVVNLISQTMR
ncbi:MAG: DUF86 domain-containing protein [Nitrospirae bacterium]|nr:DUF86 domain-containing protein [Nitrospirota bacterium]